MARSTAATPRVYWVNQFAITPDQPGGSRHFDMAKELRRLGVDAHLVASDLVLTTRAYSRRRRWTDIRPIRGTIEGVPWVWLTAGSYQQNDWRRMASMVVFMVTSFVYLVVAKAPRGSVFIGSSPQLLSAFGTWAAARLRRRGFIFEVRDLWPESYTAVSGADGGVVVGLMATLSKLLYRRADLIVVLAEANADAIAAYGVARAKIRFIPNGVDLADFIPADASVTPLREPGRFTFVYAGAHGPANGLDLVVRACDLLQARGSQLRVVLLGDGPSKAELQAQAAGLGLHNLVFHDPVAKRDVGPTLQTADGALMILADAELFTYGVSPNKLFDYMAAGLPVVTNVPGYVASIVRDARVGEAVPASDPAALADAMERVASVVTDDANAFGDGREYVNAHYERRALAHRLHDCIVEVQ